MEKKLNLFDTIFKIIVVALMIDWTFALWKIAENIAKLKP